MGVCKVSELEGAALDWAVAKAIGLKPFVVPLSRCDTTVWAIDGSKGIVICDYSKSWELCGPLIEKYQVEFCIADGFGVCVNIRYSDKSECHFDSYLIAACRAIVASVLGDVVEIPDELL